MNQDVAKIKEELTLEELQSLLAKKQKEQKLEQKQKINAYYRDRDAFIGDTVKEFKELQKHLKQLKYTSIEKGTELYNKVFSLHEKELPADRKTISLQNDSKTQKIVIDRQEKMAFTEEADVAITGIKDFFRNKFAGRSKTVYSLLDTILSKNKAGDYDPRLLAKLRKEVNEINDSELTSNFTLLENSQTVVGASLYLRAYEKDSNGKWKDIVVQFSTL